MLNPTIEFEMKQAIEGNGMALDPENPAKASFATDIVTDDIEMADPDGDELTEADIVFHIRITYGLDCKVDKMEGIQGWPEVTLIGPVPAVISIYMKSFSSSGAGHALSTDEMSECIAMLKASATK